jgi:hypothetical protein
MLMGELLSSRIRLIQYFVVASALVSLMLVAIASTQGPARWASWALPLLIIYNVGIARVSRGRQWLMWGLSGISIVVSIAIIYSFRTSFS